MTNTDAKIMREADMSIEQYAVRQGGMFVAKVDVPDAPDGHGLAMAQAMHYLHVYGQDGPAELWKRSTQRKWRPMDIRVGYHPDEIPS